MGAYHSCLNVSWYCHGIQVFKCIRIFHSVTHFIDQHGNFLFFTIFQNNWRAWHLRRSYYSLKRCCCVVIGLYYWFQWRRTHSRISATMIFLAFFPLTSSSFPMYIAPVTSISPFSAMPYFIHAKKHERMNDSCICVNVFVSMMRTMLNFEELFKE